MERVVLATSERPVDDPLAEYAISQDIAVYRGDLYDVASRLMSCAAKFGADYFVRLNGDCPFLDPLLVAEGISYCRDGTVDFVTNLVKMTFPYGIAVEIVKLATFRKIYKDIVLSEDHEHVTKYLYDHLGSFNVLCMESELPELAATRLVVDTEEDFRMFEVMTMALSDQLDESRYVDFARLYMRIRQSQFNPPFE